MNRSLVNDSNAMGGTIAFRPCTRSFSPIFVVSYDDDPQEAPGRFDFVLANSSMFSACGIN